MFLDGVDGKLIEQRNSLENGRKSFNKRVPVIVFNFLVGKLINGLGSDYSADLCLLKPFSFVLSGD